MSGTNWTAIGAGKTLIGLDSGDSDFDTVEGTGGSKTHQLSTDEMPAHTHSSSDVTYNSWAEDPDNGGSYQYARTPVTSQTSGSTGDGGAHNNVQPYITVYFWKRTA